MAVLAGDGAGVAAAASSGHRRSLIKRPALGRRLAAIVARRCGRRLNCCWRHAPCRTLIPPHHKPSTMCARRRRTCSPTRARRPWDRPLPGRFLGMSTITYDPGDMADYRRVFVEEPPPQLTSDAFHDLVIAQKVQELLVPNLPLFWRIPAVDGFDGGVLPLAALHPLCRTARPARPARARWPPARTGARDAGRAICWPCSTSTMWSPTRCAISGSRMSSTTGRSGPTCGSVDGALAVDAPLPFARRTSISSAMSTVTRRRWPQPATNWRPWQRWKLSTQPGRRAGSP